MFEDLFPVRVGTEDSVGCLSYLHMNARTPQKPHAQEDFTQCSPHESKQRAEVKMGHMPGRERAQTLEHSLQYSRNWQLHRRT